MAFDRRLVPAREDLVAGHLAEFSPGADVAVPVTGRITAAVADLRPRPVENCVADTQLLFGEAVLIYQREPDWAWVQAVDDGYIGYVRAGDVSDVASGEPTHRVASLGSNVYREPSLKTPTYRSLPFAARVAVLETSNGYSRIGPDAWLPEPHLVPVDRKAPDWVTIAEMFQGVPYLWGGRSNLGLDCSALIQLARQAAGYRCLRDSDMQQASEGETLPEGEPLRRGDLMFWRGHVGVMTDDQTLLHANGHHMVVTREPVDAAIRRIFEAEASPVTRRARLA